MIKLKAGVEGLEKLVISDKVYNIDSDGCIEVDSNDVETAKSHGFVDYVGLEKTDKVVLKPVAKKGK